MKSLISLFAILALAFAIPSKRDVSLDKLLSIEKELAGMLKTSAQSEEKIETHVKGIMDPSRDQFLTERNIHTDIYIGTVAIATETATHMYNYTA